MPDILHLRWDLAAPHADATTARVVAAAAADPALARSPAPALLVRVAGVEPAGSAPVRRAALVLCVVAAAVVAWFIGSSGADRPAEPALLALLRGMAAIKVVLALSMAGLVWWRFGQPVSIRVAATYIACAALLGFCAVLIWQLALIAAAAVLFHVAGLIGMVVALRDGLPASRWLRLPADRCADRRQPAANFAN